MKNLTKKQIEVVKGLKNWSLTAPKGITKKMFNEIVDKKINREILTHEPSLKGLALLRKLITDSLRTKGTPYHKVLITGKTGVYYASPVYSHSDYNKFRAFELNEESRNFIRIFNGIVK